MKEETSSDSLVLFLLMGASNLARGYSMLSHTLSKSLENKHSKFLNALGPGRAVCARGGMFNFTYPPIRDCRVIEKAEKESRKASRTVVLITDLGNDLMYGISADTLIESLEEMINRMLEWNAEIFITNIHVDLKKDVSKNAFLFLRFLFYPGSKVAYEEADYFVAKVNEYLEEKSRKNERVFLITGMGSFAGMDKIHYSLLKTHAAWSLVADEILEAMNYPVKNKMRLSDGIKSISANLWRLIFCDMFRIQKKGREYF